MDLNIIRSNNNKYENRETLKNIAKEILKQKGASEGSMKKILDLNTLTFDNKKYYYGAHLEILDANNKIMTQKFIKSFNTKKNKDDKKTIKKAKLGELWDLLDENTYYEGELVDFVIDNSAKNIFAAA